MSRKKKLEFQRGLPEIREQLFLWRVTLPLACTLHLKILQTIHMRIKLYNIAKERGKKTEKHKIPLNIFPVTFLSSY